ncbi:nuclear transport factor 2 family protein [Cyanobacteria bacterium FACHB-471]|nr:nuclear transport factor 2 family protein [Cyanobacteria bacterium FACHB-471]
MKLLKLLRNSILIWHLTCGTCAIALVGSLTVYQRSVLADPLTIVQNHWDAIASRNADRTVQQYSQDAVLLWTHGSLRGRYQGSQIYQNWQTFFKKYQIESSRIVEQNSSDRTVKAEIVVISKSNASSNQQLHLFYEVRIDEQGKILYEVWQTKAQ